MRDPLTWFRQLRHADAWIYGTMLFSACLSLLASFVLSVDAVRLAADPHLNLSCDINDVISREELAALTHGYARVAGYDKESLAAKAKA